MSWDVALMLFCWLSTWFCRLGYLQLLRSINSGGSNFRCFSTLQLALKHFLGKNIETLLQYILTPALVSFRLAFPQTEIKLHQKRQFSPENFKSIRVVVYTEMAFKVRKLTLRGTTVFYMRPRTLFDVRNNRARFQGHSVCGSQDEQGILHPSLVLGRTVCEMNERLGLSSLSLRPRQI